MTDDNAAIARAIIESNSYMVLGTADWSGLPWAAPVWFATAGYREFFWVSSPEARHSHNLAVRPELSIVIFDSTVAPGSGAAVYMSATARELRSDEVGAGLGVFARGSEAAGLRVWRREDVQPPARHRTYRAVASEHFVLGQRDERVPVSGSALAPPGG